MRPSSSLTSRPWASPTAMLSPFFETSSDSSHGYDVSDHNRLREELGGEPAFVRFADALRRHGLGLLVDLVPNHMGIAGNRNAGGSTSSSTAPALALRPLLRHRLEPCKAELAGKVLLPILGDQYGIVLERGRAAPRAEGRRFTVRYYETVLPIAPRSTAGSSATGSTSSRPRWGPSHPVAGAEGAGHLVRDPARRATERDPERLAAHRGGRPGQAAGVERLAACCGSPPRSATFVDENVAASTARPTIRELRPPRRAARRAGLPGRLLARGRRGDQLPALLRHQRAGRHPHGGPARSSRRRTGSSCGSSATGAVTGLRIDHPDGLYAPAEYFRAARGTRVAR